MTMKLSKMILAGFAVLVVALGASCQSLNPVGADSYDLYLLIGQSNMAGRDQPTDIDKTSHARVMMLNQKGEWAAAVEPMHFDKPERVGVGPGLSFGKAIAEADEDRIVGLIPAAAGGSPIAAWTPGGYHNQTKSYPYDDAVRRARIAMQSGTIKAILWHQGESDSRSPDKAALYRQALTELVERFRRDLNVPDAPFIVGELGSFLVSDRLHTVDINRILRSVPDFIPNSGFVSAEGLTDKGDRVHFSAESARILGERYAEKLIEIRAAP